MPLQVTTKKLTAIFASPIITLSITIILYINYIQHPECVQSESASQCWDFRPLLIPAFSFLTLILILSSLYKYRILTNEI